MKLVLNVKAGGFGLSEAGVRLYCEIKRLPLWIRPGNALTGPQYWLAPPPQDTAEADDGRLLVKAIERTDPALIQTVERLGAEANGRHAELAVVEVPEGVRWTICERDGAEWVAEAHRTWP